jgi:DNA-binding NarL/FixJ family response regulator
VPHGSVYGLSQCKREILYGEVTPVLSMRRALSSISSSNEKAKPQRARVLRQRGLTIMEIVTALGISERTVFRYLTAASA